MLSVRNKAIIVDKCLLEELDNNVLLCSVQIGWVLKYDRKKKVGESLNFLSRLYCVQDCFLKHFMEHIKVQNINRNVSETKVFGKFFTITCKKSRNILKTKDNP